MSHERTQHHPDARHLEGQHRHVDPDGFPGGPVELAIQIDAGRLVLPPKAEGHLGLLAGAKVYDLPRRLRAVRDTRVYPDIPT